MFKKFVADQRKPIPFSKRKDHNTLCSLIKTYLVNRRVVSRCGVERSAVGGQRQARASTRLLPSADLC